MKRLLYLLLLMLVWFTASAQETPPPGLKAVNAQFYIDPANGDIWQQKGSPYGWHRVAKWVDIVSNKNYSDSLHNQILTGNNKYTGIDTFSVIRSQNYEALHGGGFITEGGDNSMGSLIGSQLTLNSFVLNTYDPGTMPIGDGTSLRMLNANGIIFFFDANGIIRRAKDGASVLWSNSPLVTPKDSLIVTLSDTTSLKAYNGASINAFVTDTTGTGGNFKYVSNITKNDGGKYFPATGKGSGTWVRDAPRKYYNLAWYGFDRTGVRNDSLKLARLITSVDSGSTIYAQTGRYNLNIKLSKSIHIIGEKQPLYNGSRLIDGTVILGFIDLVNHFGASISMLGIDQHAANPFFTNGIMNNSSDQGTVTSAKLLQKISNISLLGRGYLAADPVKTSQHAIYISSGTDIDVRNINIYRYAQGIAIKASYTKVDNVTFVDNNVDGIIIKADDLHLDVHDIDVTNIVGYSDTAGTTASVYAQASAGGHLHNINFGHITLSSTGSREAAFFAQGLNGSTLMDGINLTNFTSFGSASNGVYASQSGGAIVRDVNISNSTVTNAAGSAFKVLSADKVTFNNAHSVNAGNYSFENQGGTAIQVSNATSSTPTTGEVSGSFDIYQVNNNLSVNGNVGIGTRSPGAKLDVYNNSMLASTAGSYALISSQRGNVGNDIIRNIFMVRETSGSTGAGTFMQEAYAQDATGTDPTLNSRNFTRYYTGVNKRVFGSAAVPYMTMQDSLICVGCNAATVPASKLHVQGYSTGTYSTSAAPTALFRVRNTTTSGAANEYASLIFQVSSNNNSNAGIGFISVIQPTAAANTADMSFMLRNAGVYGEKMRISANGNIVFNAYTTAGVLHNTAAGVVTSSLVNLATEVTGALPAANGGVNNTVTAINATYPVTTANQILIADPTTAAFTATLPTAVGNTGKTFTFKRSVAGANVFTIGTTSSQTIDGITTYTLTAQYKYVTVASNGANWIIIANN